MSPKGIINCVLVLVHFFHQLFKEKNDNDFHEKKKKKVSFGGKYEKEQSCFLRLSYLLINYLNIRNMSNNDKTKSIWRGYDIQL